MIDVLVIGGGPAGLSAALMLGRCRRTVVVCDAGTPRNRFSRALHGYLTRDGCPPADLLRHARGELAAYGVEYRRSRVEAVTPAGDGFTATLEGGEVLRARRLLIATGVADAVPPIPGFLECYGLSVFHCPYCDGWEWRDRPLAVFGRGGAGTSLALSLLTWSADVRLVTGGPGRLRPRLRERLMARGIRIHEQPVRELEHDGGALSAVAFTDGSREACDALFFTEGQQQQASFARALGCEFERRGTVRTNRYGETNVAGVFVVGDASRDVQFVIVAAAEGAKAAVAINKQFQTEAGHVPPLE